MELILQTGLTHQQKAVDSIADVFKNTTISQPNQYYGNPEIFTDGILFENIKQVQKTNGLHSSLRILSREVKPLHLDIKMETGTGKHTFIHMPFTNYTSSTALTSSL